MGDRVETPLWRRLARVVVFLVAVCAIVGGCAVLVLPATWSPAGSGSDLHALHGFVVLCAEVFAFHAGLACLAAGLLAFASKRWVLGVACAALGAFHAGPGVADSLTSGQGAFSRGAESEPSLTVLSHNLLFSRESLEHLRTIVDREQPDAIMLQEVVGERAGEVLDLLEADFPYIVHPDTHRWGAMLLSKHPFVDIPDPLPGVDGWPIDQPVGVIDFEGTRVALMSVHLPAPNRLRQIAAGPVMSADLAEWIDSSSFDAAIFAGDFNAPLWATRMSALREAGLARAHDAVGGGRGATWPARTPLRFAPGIRLDQIAWTGTLRPVESRVLEPTGSDHRPVLATFVLTQEAEN